MREILFRGKRTDNGEWVEGYYSNLGGNSPRILKENIFIGKRGRVLEFENIKVLHETVGQYTGLTDKNGRKIFEGDIVRERGGESCQGYYEIDNVLIIEIPKTLTNIVIGYDFGCEYKIIGNIHDNPELLEGAKENE